MRIYKYDKNNSKWYKKIDWLKLVIISFLTFILWFLIFNYLGSWKDVYISLETSLVITLLTAFKLILNDFLEDKKRIFLVENNKISYIEIHDGKDGKFLSDLEFDEMIKDVNPQVIVEKQKKFEGIDCGEIVDLIKINKRMNKVILKVKVKAKEWKPQGVITISKLEIVEKEYTKKIIVSKDYNDFDDLLRSLAKKAN